MKKVISIALALLMVAVMLPVMAMAAEVEVSDETSLKNAVATNGNNIKLTQNITLTGTLTIDSGVTIVLDLAGNKISAAMNGPHMISSAGNLTIIDSVGTGSIAKEGDSSHLGYVLENHGTMALNGIKVTSASSKASAIENGWFTASDNKTGKNCDMTITNSDISQANGSGGLYTIKNDDYGVMVINGGNFTNSTAGAGTVLNWNDLTINDGNFTGASAVRTLKQGELGYEVGNTLINGGTFNGKIDTLPNYSDVQIGVMGGTFNSDVTEYAGDTLVVENNGTYYVGGTARDAIENATSGTFTVKKAENGTSLTVKPGVTVENGMNDGKVTVNGNEVKPGESYTVPGTITIIVPSDGGNTTTTPSTDNTKNPGTGANDFVGVAAAMAVVSLLGAAAVIRKK